MKNLSPKDCNPGAIHVSYLGIYLGFSYIPKKTKLRTKTEFKIRGTKGWDKGKVTRILKKDEDKINAFFNDHNDYNIDTEVQIRLKAQLNDNEEAIIGNERTLPLVNISKSSYKCECGCKDVAIDYFRGEAVCPQCGLIDDSITIYEPPEDTQ